MINSHNKWNQFNITTYPCSFNQQIPFSSRNQSPINLLNNSYSKINILEQQNIKLKEKLNFLIKEVTTQRQKNVKFMNQINQKNLQIQHLSKNNENQINKYSQNKRIKDLIINKLNENKTQQRQSKNPSRMKCDDNNQFLKTKIYSKKYCQYDLKNTLKRPQINKVPGIVNGKLTFQQLSKLTTLNMSREKKQLIRVYSKQKI